MSNLIVGVAVLAVGIVMLRFRERIEAFWAFLIPARRPRWYRIYAYVGGPLFLIFCGVALVVSGVVEISN